MSEPHPETPAPRAKAAAVVRTPLGAAPRRRIGATSGILRWTGVLVLLILVAALVYRLTATPEEVAAAKPAMTEQEYLASKPGGDAPKLTNDQVEAMTAAPEDMKADDGTNGSTIEVKADLQATALVDNLKDLAVGQKYNVIDKEGKPLTLQFDATHFRYEDCKVMVVVTDPTGKVLDTIKGLDRAEARRKMIEINDATHNVETVYDPEQPAKFIAQKYDYVITVPGDPALELNEDTKNAFGLDRLFYIANPVKH